MANALLISIHALVKRATLNQAFLIIKGLDFNPRPRKEGDTLLLSFGRILVISIHALVKRATQGAVIATRNSPISIHALVKRATGLDKKFDALSDISIHALVKRATYYKQTVQPYDLEFQSTPS